MHLYVAWFVHVYGFALLAGRPAGIMFLRLSVHCVCAGSGVYSRTSVCGCGWTSLCVTEFAQTVVRQCNETKKKSNRWQFENRVKV